MVYGGGGGGEAKETSSARPRGNSAGVRCYIYILYSCIKLKRNAFAVKCKLRRWKIRISHPFCANPPPPDPSSMDFKFISCEDLTRALVDDDESHTPGQNMQITVLIRSHHPDMAKCALKLV